MLVHLRRLSSQTLIYGLGDAVTRLAGLLLLPLYTRLLTPDDYGKLAICILFGTITALILEFGQRTALFRFYFKNDDPEARRRLTGTILIFLLVSAVLILLPVILFFERIAAPLVSDASLIPLIQITLAGTFFDVGSIIPFAIFRAEQRATQYATLSFARFLISLVLNIIAVVVLRLGVVGIVYANLLTSALFFIISLWLTTRALDWAFDTQLLKQLLRYGLPLVPVSLATWALNFSDRFFLERYKGLGQVGVYAVGYSIVSALPMLTSWFNTAYSPYIYSISNQADARNVLARMMTYATTLFTLVGLCLSLFAQEILAILVPASYFEAARVVPLLVVGYLSFELFYLFGFALDLTGKTFYYPVVVVTGAVLNLALNIMLIPRWGMMGAALATALSYAVLPVFEYLIVRKLYLIPYEWLRLFKLLVITVAIYAVSTFVKTGRLWVDLGMGLALILAWALALYCVRFFAQRELAAARAASGAILRGFRSRFQHKVSKAS